MKQHTTQIVLWAIAALFAARLTWVAIQHHMPVFDTATIAVFSLYGLHAGAENVARAFTAARQTGAEQ